MIVFGTPLEDAALGVAAQIAAALGVALAPAIAAGFLIVIALTLSSDAAPEEPKVDCKKVKDECIAKCVEETLPTGDYAGMPFHDCMRRCLEHANCWGK